MSKDKIRKAMLTEAPMDIKVLPFRGTKVGVKAMTLREQRDFLNAASRDGEIDRNRFTPQLLIAVVVDPDTGDPVLEQADADPLWRMRFDADVRALITAAMRAAGLGDDDIEEAAADLKGPPTGDSS
jgi:hypothetical protein